MNNKSTIVTAFLSAYEMGGVAYNAIEAVRELHDLHLSTKSMQLAGKWLHYYSEVLPKQVQEQTEAFDFSTVDSGRVSPIIAEIDKDLRGIAGGDRERYLFSLLTPFAGLAKIYNPTAEINRLQTAIEGLESNRTIWESQPQDKPLFNINGEPAASPKEQAEACSGMIERYRGSIERLNYINRRFCDVLDNSERGTIEYFCNVWVSAAIQFANRLDALLLTRGIDLLQLQDLSGIYLKDRREITDVDFYIGSVELAQYYINALPPRRPSSTLAEGKPAASTAQPQQGNQPPASQEPSTERAKKAFEKALEAGYMEKTATGYKWLYNGGRKGGLGYFLIMVYNPDNTRITPFTALGALFGVSRLDRAADQATSTKKPQQWRVAIDELLKNL
jgi:hypothetical protein